MHPDKFLRRARKPQLSEAERADRLESLGALIAAKRKESVDARRASGIESIWLACEEAYLGIDDMNRGEFSDAQWAKPMSINGPVTTNRTVKDETRSTVFVRLTSRYVDHAAAKVGEILLPVDDKAFSLEPTPVPDLVKQQNDQTPLVDPVGQPVMRPAGPGEQPPAQAAAVPGQAPAQVPMTVADRAKAALDQAAASAEKAETRIYDWMVEGKYPAEMRKVVKDAARIGVGVLKAPFPAPRVSKALTRSKNGIEIVIKQLIKPSLQWIDPWNLFPADGCGEDIHAGDDLFERDFLSKRKLKALKKDETYLSSQIDKVVEEGPGKVNTEGSNPHEKKNKNRFEVWYYYGSLSRDDLEVAIGDASLLDGLPAAEDIPVIATMVNDTVIRAVVNPLDSGNYPYRTMSWSRRPGHWAGVGVGEMISMPQRTCNASTRALMNNAGLASGVQIVIDQLGITPADSKWSLTPNKIWYKTAEGTGSVGDSFEIHVIPSLFNDLMGIVQYAMRLAEESSGIPLITQGQIGPDDPKTFGQAELQNNNSLTWLRSIGYSFDDQITEPVVNDFYEWLLLDPTVPDDEKGDFKINANGSIVMVERAIQEDTITGLLSAAQNPAFEISPAKLMTEYLKGKRMDPRKIQYTDEEKAKIKPQPPLPVMVEQIKGQNALQLAQAEGQIELQHIEAEAQQEQQALQSGGTTPHMASAMAQIGRERIRAVTAERVEASRANAEAARADKELQIAQQNGQFKIQEMQLTRDLAILQYAQKHQLTLEQVKADLAKTAMQEQTKRQLAGAEVALAQSEGDKDRGLDLHKHTTSLVNDQMSTPVTP